MCDGPRFDDEHRHRFGAPLISEAELAQNYEYQLRSAGIDAHDTRFWNGCLRTFVYEGGHDVMRFFDPDTLAEVPLN